MIERPEPRACARLTTRSDATIVISSDWGLTIYLTVPAHLVRCDARTLWLLLSDLDAIYWMLGDTEIATVSLIRLPVGSAVNKPHHSVVVVNGVWTDENFAAEIRRQSAEVVLSARSRIDLTLLRAERGCEIARRKTPARQARSPWPGYSLEPRYARVRRAAWRMTPACSTTPLAGSAPVGCVLAELPERRDDVGDRWAVFTLPLRVSRRSDGDRAARLGCVAGLRLHLAG